MASNAERLDALYDRFWHQSDWHAGEEIMAPDIEWIGMAEDATLGGTRYGPRAVNQFFSEWLDAWEIAGVDWSITEVTPDLLLVRSQLHTRGRGSGVEADAEIGQIWEFEDGKAIRQSIYRHYEDARVAADEMLQARGP
jgi:ketosteroid isomerase-like protein